MAAIKNKLSYLLLTVFALLADPKCELLGFARVIVDHYEI